MKKVLKFAGLISAVLALIGFILIMATPVAAYHDSNANAYFGGLNAIFATGKCQASGGGISIAVDFDGKLAWSALLAWIFVLVALLILVAGIVLPLLKVKALDKFAGVLNLVAVCLLVVAGIFVFISKATFWAANKYDGGDYSLGIGWIFAGIFFLLAGAIAIAPAAVDFLGKKK